MKSLFYKFIVLLLVVVSSSACFNKTSPNYQYFPDMYFPVSYEAFGEYDVFVNEKSARLPVEGTISRGWKPYDFEDSVEGFQMAKAQLKNPLPYSEEHLASGQQLYTIYCAVCHGDKGDGKGILVDREKILGVPSYADIGRAITEGSTYHVMYYGLNTMGSYASQTSIEERWEIDHYVMKLKAALEGNPEREFETGTVNDTLVDSEEKIESNEDLTTEVNSTASSNVQE